MSARRIARLLCALALAAGSAPAPCEDIDLFQTNPRISGVKPNVLIVLDNTANWTSPFVYEKAAVVAAVRELDDRFRVGLMMFNETGSPNDSVEGSYIRAAIRDMNSTNKEALSGLVEHVDVVLDKANKSTYGLAMHEAYLYFKSTPANPQQARAGIGRLKRDFAGNVLPTTSNNANSNPKLVYSNAVYALPGNAFVSGDSSTYLGPMVTNCPKNYIIFISNGPAGDNLGDTQTATALLQGLGGSTTTIPLNPSGLQENLADEYARFMYKTDLNANSQDGTQNIITYTIDVSPGTTGQGPANTALLKSMASQGHGRYFVGSDEASLANALRTIFNELQAVDSAFASVSLPVTVSVRGTYLNQVYMGVFRPDRDASPLWLGNLKLYKIAFDTATNTSYITDSQDDEPPIEDAITGFVINDAISFWTEDSTFWDFSPSGSPPSGSDSPDGPVVEKGGAAQQLREAFGVSGRSLYTCLGTGCNAGAQLSTMPFNTANSNVTAALLGLTNPITASLSRSGRTVTVTANGHGYSDGQMITVVGASPDAYNGFYTVSSAGTNTFTYQVVTTPHFPDPGTSIRATALETAKTASLRNGNGANSDVVTATFLLPHGYLTGDRVFISGVASPAQFNGLFTITSATLTTFEYTVTSPPAGGTAATGTITVSRVGNSPIAVSALTRDDPASGTTATASATTSSDHGFSNGQKVVISGASGVEFNGAVSVAVTSPASFNYTVSTGPATPPTGTITVQRGSTNRDTLINWVRGVDNLDENNNRDFTDVRASIHGDVLHSRPAVINYGRTSDNRDIVVYYGANDGLLHAVKGGRDLTDGNEKWAMIFPEHFDKLDRLRSQVPSISSTHRKPYFVDGQVGTYVKDGGNNGRLGDADDVVRIYVGMRRGGRFLYALDVNDPDVPKFLWKISNLTAGFSELGQTWSEAKTGLVRGSAGGTRQVAIFGAGYDPDNDDLTVPGSATKGRGVFVIDGADGTLIKHFGPAQGMVHSIPADVVPLDRDGDGVLDRVYAADTGGNVWRMDIGDADPTNWNAYKIASVGGTGSEARKFLHAPSIVFGDSFDTVLIGSGNREQPFENTVQNYFFMFMDTNTGLLGRALNIAVDELAVVPTDGTPANLTNKKGWSLALREGEKVVGSATTLLGTTFFGTNAPLSEEEAEENARLCKNDLGTARLYAISYLDAAPTVFKDASGNLVTNQEREGGGFPQAPAGVQTTTDDGHVATGAASGPTFLTPPGAGQRRRIFWYREIDN